MRPVFLPLTKRLRAEFTTNLDPTVGDSWGGSGYLWDMLLTQHGIIVITMMVYPNRTHCICEGENTTLHLFTMLTKYVDEHLGGRRSLD